MAIIYGCLIFALVILPCEIGQRLTDTFDEINFQFEQLRWYLLAIEIRRMVTTTMIFAQKSIIFECYGVLFCNRDQLKTVNQSNFYRTMKVLQYFGINIKNIPIH